MRGKISSRQFLVLLEGIINNYETSWLRFTVRQDALLTEQERLDRLEAEVKAVNRAQMYDAPLRMSDLGEDYHSHE